MKATSNSTARLAATPLLLLLLQAGVVNGFDGATVLGPSATPLGYSLTDMLVKLAQFQASFNDAQYYPQTPFQILYAPKFHPKTVSCPAGGTGVHVISNNAFIVPEGTLFFVPLAFIDDAPPLFGVFPATRAAAIDYFFASASYGGSGFQITVDGVTTPIGPDYLAGPVTFSPPLVDGATAAIQLGAFLAPLGKGHHVVSIGGGYFGAGFSTVNGIQCYFGDFSYLVNVVD